MAKRRPASPLGPLPADEEEKTADPNKAHIVGNYLTARLEEDFKDCAPQDILLGLTMALAYYAKISKAVPTSVVAMVSRCLKAPMTRFVPRAPTAKA